ncbi:tRNA-uridine aminocarboxypropyltransferase [uncultured Comamonas sp.]|uniref:tRNA-uridine aminocarboxypropyltransferase n=1 Tax=uncultured Comamonas sp. TaxID=114710 RepID=UPI0025D56D14|nr:tRNA-uridine aminocarboxypropyltransferase [uncultured Comamonas sp.]
MPASTPLPPAAPSPHKALASTLPPHAVSRLRQARLARSTRPFLARGGPKGERCEGCRLRPSHCMCTLRPGLATRAAFCLLMHDAEPLKPSNTGWLIADVVQDTHAFGWSRTEVDPQLQALLADPQWQPYVVFPGEYAEPAGRVVEALDGGDSRALQPGRRPLFILLDATWSEARKMFRKSPYLDGFPVLSLHPDLISRYQLRRSKRDDHFCTSEVAALCLELVGDAGDVQAGRVLESYLGVFTERYLRAKHQQPVDEASSTHQCLRERMEAASAKRDA